MKINRVIVAILSIVITLASSQFTSEAKRKKDDKAKYIFLFIGDGMGMGQVSLTESYLSYKAGKLGGEQLSFTKFPYLALCNTYSANRNITCSAAAGTAIACGEKTNNEHIGVDPDGKPLESIAYVLHNQGYNVGIMTTVPVNHATPAAFYGHNSSRYGYYEISQEIVSSGFEFFGGSGFYNYKGRNNDKPAVDIYIEENGYDVCYGTKEFSARDRSKDIVFIQESGRETNPENYVSDGAEEGDVELYEMLQMGLEVLGDENPFFIMCEGGNIDWAAHDNKTMTTVMEVVAFDQAIREAIEFYNEHPEETLIIVTADHETGGVSIGEGKDWRPEIIDWPMLEKHWFESGEKNVLGYEENREINKKALIGWTSSHHTAARVPAFAIGKGAEKFHGIIENTDIKGKILGE
jgi:alkaline phosphatase